MSKNIAPSIENEIFELAKLQCSEREIAAKVGLDADTMARRYAAILKNAREQGKAEIKAMQWAQARQGKWDAVRWLSIQHLREHEKVDHSIEFKNPFTEMSTLEMLEKARELVKLLEAKYEHEIGEPPPALVVLPAEGTK